MRRDLLLWILLVSLVGVGGCASSGKQASGEPASAKPLAGLALKIKSNKLIGLVPMDLEITGRCLDGDQKDVPLTDDRRVRLQVETSHYRIVGGDRSTHFHTAGIDEIDAAGLKNPLVRTLTINRPGTYRFQLILEDMEGNQLRSNTIEIKAR